jgi:hypothetical protein
MASELKKTNPNGIELEHHPNGEKYLIFPIGCEFTYVGESTAGRPLITFVPPK